MSRSLEYAKGLAGMPTGSTMNVSGLLARAAFSEGSSRSQSGLLESSQDRNKNLGYLPGTEIVAERYEGSIGEMETGDIGWTTPWMICVGHDGKLYMRKDQELKEQEGGTAQMDVFKVEEALFLSEADIAQFSNEFIPLDENDKWLQGDYLVRVYSNRDEFVRAQILRVAEKVGVESIIQRIKQLFAKE